MDEEEIIGYEALWASMMKCKAGVIWKDSVATFFLNGVREIRKLSEELKNGTYKERPHRFFTVTSPKERRIMSISFRDRIYQRSLNDIVIYPEMVKHFIYDNGACQKGKGTKFARERMKCHLQRYWRKHGLDGWILKMDVKGYYPNMRHDVAKETFRRYLPANVQARAEKLGEIGFALHREKTRIIPLREGVMFLGFHFRLTETGKVILLIDSDRVAAERRKLKRMAQLVKAGKMTREKADECYRSWKAHAENGNSWRLIRKMDRYYMSLWEDGV